MALITGGAGAVVFSVFAGLAFREDNALADRCGSGAGRVCTGAQVRRLRAYNATADAGLAIGAAGLVTGLTLYFLQRDNGHEGEEGGSTEARAQSRATLRVAPSLDASSAGLVLMGTY